MDKVYIRLCETEEIPSLLPLMKQLGYSSSYTELESRFKKFMENQGYGVAVACDEDKIVGLVAWSKTTLFVADKTRIHIEGLVVEESYRGRGVGKTLMLFVEEMVRTLGSVVIDLTSGVRRAKDGSHEFYKKLGYDNQGPMAKLYLRKDFTS